jgi:4-hydroxy-tetrahydrodipicolinate synthase
MSIFTGCGTALVTPFRHDLSLDEETLRRLIRRQIDGGIDFLVPCGTTGESPTLTRDEHVRVVAITVEEAGGKVPVLAGAGGYDTAGVIALGEALRHVGADGLLSVNPYYNRPTQEGLYQHFKAIADAVSLPIVLYNIPGRTGVNIETPTLCRLAVIENIVGVKEASGNIGQMAAVAHAVPERFDILCGDDAITIPLFALGGRGVVSVVANEIPAGMTGLTHLAMEGDFAGARAAQRAWMPLMEMNFIESNPIPVKTAMSMMGLLEAVWRLPMTSPAEETRARIEKVLRASGLMPPRADDSVTARGNPALPHD